MQNQTALLQKNAELSKQVAEIKPAWTDYMDNFKNKFRLRHSHLCRLANVLAYHLYAAGVDPD